jgi:hypothetical protein
MSVDSKIAVTLHVAFNTPEESLDFIEGIEGIVSKCPGVISSSLETFSDRRKKRKPSKGKKIVSTKYDLAHMPLISVRVH